MSDEPEQLDPPEELGYRPRGRPRLPSEQKRREKLTIALNAKEMKRVMHAAADAADGPMRLQDWARRVLLAAAPEKHADSI